MIESETPENTIAKQWMKMYYNCQEKLKTVNEEIKRLRQINIRYRTDLESKNSVVSKLKKEKEELTDQLTLLQKECSDLQEKESYDDISNRPSILAAKLGAFGYRGKLSRNSPFYNMDEKMGEYVEILTIGVNSEL